VLDDSNRRLLSRSDGPQRGAPRVRLVASLEALLIMYPGVEGHVMLGLGRRASFFNCPSCKEPYHVIRVAAGPESKDYGVYCLGCGGALAARDGGYVLKYFLVRRSGPATTETERRARDVRSH
jgi:hypothetical protein